MALLTDPGDCIIQHLNLLQMLQLLCGRESTEVLQSGALHIPTSLHNSRLPSGPLKTKCIPLLTIS